jgi:hypothetical protein
MQRLKDCSLGIVLVGAVKNATAWEEIVPFVFIYHYDFIQAVNKVVARQEALKLMPTKTGGRIFIILDGVTIDEAGIDSAKMDDLGVLVVACSAGDFKGTTLLPKPVWEAANRISKPASAIVNRKLLN